MLFLIKSQPHTGWAKKWYHLLCTLTLPNINRFSKFFHFQNQETICNETVAIDPTTPQVCHYTTMWNFKRRAQAGNATDHVDWAWPVVPEQPGLKSSWLCCLGCPSTDNLSMSTIHNSQPAKESHRHLVGQSAAAFGWSHHWSVASPAWMRCPEARRTH